MKIFNKKINILIFISLLLMTSYSALSISVDQLLLYYTFDNDTLITANRTSDVSLEIGNFSMNYTNAVFNASGIINTSLDFESASSHEAFHDMSLIPLGENFTVAYWINPETAGAADSTVWNSNIASRFVEHQILADGRYRTSIFDGDWDRLTTDAPLTTGTWYFFVTTFNTLTNNMSFYVNGVFNKSNTTSGHSNGLTTGLMGRQSGGTDFYDGRMDEFSIWNRTLSGGDVLELWNDGAGFQYPFSFTVLDINISSSSPPNNSQFSFNTINFNISVNSTFNFNATLLINGTTNLTRYFAAGQSVFVSFNQTLINSRSYTYRINITNNITNNSRSTILNTFHLDNVNPQFVTAFGNNHVVYGGRLIGRFNFTDNFNIFSYEVYVNGRLNDSGENLNSTNYQYFLNLNASVFPLGVNNLTINISDGHTSNYISDWKVNKNYITKSLTYKFTTADDYVRIKPKSASLLDSFDTTKLTDRYSFVHNRRAFSSQETYVLESDHRIVEIRNSKYPGWFIIPELKKWVDFKSDSEYNDVTVNKINDFKFEITLNGLNKKDLVFNSIGSLNTISRNYSFFVGNVTTILTTPVLETSFQTYRAEFTYNSTYISSINANLTWNGTNIGFTSKVTGDTQINITKLFTVPNIDAVTSINVSWNYTITGVNNSEINITSDQQQNILDLSLNSCIETSTNATITMSTFDEVDDSRINSSIDVTFEFFAPSVNTTKINRSFEFRNNLNYTVCLEPFNQTLLTDAFISYVSTNDTHSQRNYFLNSFEIGNNTKRSLTLYLINDSLDSDVNIEVTDEDDDPLDGRFIKVLRYFPGNNSFKTVEIARTGTDGDTLARLVLNDVFYKFVIDNKNETIFISNNQKVLSTTLFFQVILGDDFIENIEKLEKFDYSFIYDNDTGIYEFIWNDLQGITRDTYLRVVQKAAAETLICENTSSSAAGEMTCSINISSSGVFIGEAFVDTNFKNSFSLLKVTETNLQDNFRNFGPTGLLIQIMILNVLVGIGIWSPPAAMVFAAVSILFGSAMGIIGIGYSVVLVLIALFIFFIGVTKE